MPIYSSLHIKQFELPVSLGWPDEERARTQTICLELYLRYPTEPLACKTDQLDDHFCYDLLTKKIQDQIENRSFRLLEYLSREIYQIIKQNVPDNTLVTVGVKKQPPIAAIKAGVQCWYGDEKIA
jgi:7,8-dihydroneopterin aldolase/epimerase/oxygenase